MKFIHSKLYSATFEINSVRKSQFILNNYVILESLGILLNKNIEKRLEKKVLNKNQKILISMFN